MGIINVGGNGSVTADGVNYVLGYKEALYLGREQKKFLSAVMRFHAASLHKLTPAHQAYPSRKVGRDEAEIVT